MADAKYYMDLMMAECESIIEGDYGDETQEHIDAFMDEMRGFKFPLFCTQSSDLPNDRTIRGMRRAKGCSWPTWRRSRHRLETRLP